MALEAVVSPQHLFGYTSKDFHTIGDEGWTYDFGGVVAEDEKGLVLECEMSGSGGGGDCGNWNPSFSSMLQNLEDWNVNLPSPETARGFAVTDSGAAAPIATTGRTKRRRRTKSYKNKEDVESQRMTHIAVERNRRKQMNEYLTVLRSLMPPSYVQRGDQASIVGGAINFVKELEQLLQTLEAQKHVNNQSSPTGCSSPFAGFFIFPQYSSCSSNISNNGIPTVIPTTNNNNTTAEVVSENRLSTADIEVTMVESHANIKVLLRRQPKQLLRMVVGLQNIRLTTLHLNVTTAVDHKVLYSFSLKVEQDCQFTSVDEIAAAVYQMVGRIQKDDVCL